MALAYDRGLGEESRQQLALLPDAGAQVVKREGATICERDRDTDRAIPQVVESRGAVADHHVLVGSDGRKSTSRLVVGLVKAELRLSSPHLGWAHVLRVCREPPLVVPSILDASRPVAVELIGRIAKR
jgi:hypothetical protein